ncbi:MAG: Crp/Fnr family transcriptional regulator [Pyrinomonadaceae bacterium]|nr:Crp/Fnr family transcriptional regulator [Pyrinomonadaceae bacterium]
MTISENSHVAVQNHLLAALPKAAIQNRLLAALPKQEYKRLKVDFENVSLSLNQILYEPNKLISDVYFPNDCMISLISTSGEEAMIEIGVIGSEGMVGAAAFLGGMTTNNRAIVQIAGNATRMSAETLKEEFARGGALQSSLLRYTQALMTQISQTAVCNRIHSLEERLARWLLMTHDRAPSNEFPLTQEFVAYMLGARRPSVSDAASRFQNAGLISYVRGKVNILDRPGLESVACKCYGIVKEEFERLLV